ncbi:MAG: HypC/HybG/HupF family hydrogenase formation chaperone [Parcubacteria group bacterium]|jgi:hydrogenase expression/formation protein HypC|nr:HypC/HybG/HupF family hydrogenase formation chaperone [Parcubacteria group bacterium]|tara:strand:- start:7183 stop:7419 length:237 start_codon:yes stop_codon:yes gene_type:complete
MCLATPSKVVKIENDWAVVESLPTGKAGNNHQHRVNLALLKDVKIGDYLLIHDQLAINKVAENEAKQILKLIEDHRKH